MLRPCTGSTECANMLQSNGGTRITHGVPPYVSSLWRQRLETVGLVTLWGLLCRLSVNFVSISPRATGLSLFQSVRTGSRSHA